MKLENKEPNYCAEVVKVDLLLDIENLDNLVGFPYKGLHALTNSFQIGELGVLFPTECQLSEDFCEYNNLYRKSEFNSIPDTKGYLEENRRVKCLKIRGNISNALLIPVNSLSYLGIKPQELKPGDKFTHINGIEICKKYVIKNPAQKSNKTKGKTKKFTRITNKTFPEHFDSEHFLRNIDYYKPDDWITVTQKIHGTSARFTNNLVLRKLSIWERLLNKFVRVNQYEYDVLAGSRRVIKDTKSEKQNDNYYDVDLWNFHLTKIQHIIPKNWVIYGEIIGWVNEHRAIQKGYTYCLPEGVSKLYVYRISTVNEDGIVVDLSWNQIKDFCKHNGLNYVPELWSGYFKDFDVDKLMNIEYNKSGYPQAIPVNKPDTKKRDLKVDEGVIIRCEKTFSPYLTKAKSTIFLEHETKQLDSGEVDLETQENIG